MAGVRVGMDMIHFAVMTDEETEAYGAPVRIPGAITGTVTPTTNSVTLYTDDKADEVTSSLGDIEIAINPKDLPRDVLAALLGATVDSNGVLRQTAADNAPYVALGWRSRKSNGKYRYYWYYKGKFQPNEEEFETKGDTPTFQTPTINGLFVSRNKDNAWRVRVDSDDAGVPNSVITNWFASVYEETPDTTRPTISSIVPADNATGVAVSAPIVITFSEPLRASTVNGGNFLLLNGSTPVATNVLLNTDLDEVSIVPASNLSASTTYTVVVTTGVQDLAGNALASASVTDFTTA